MDFKEAISKLKDTEKFKIFKKKHKEAYLCTAFFIIDVEGKQDSNQLNFQMSDEKIAVFSVGDDINLKIEELMVKKKMEKLKENVKVDVEDVVLVSKKQIEEKEMKGKVSKIMAILEVLEGRTIWNITCFLELMQILNIHIDAISGKLLKSDKMSLAEFFNKPADYIG